MTQTITNLGEIGDSDGAMLTPIDLVLQRGGSIWNLTGYISPTIKVWDIRTRAEVASPGGVTIETPNTDGIVRWLPLAAAFISGQYEARVHVTTGAKTEPSGLFRFSIAAADNG